MTPELWSPKFLRFTIVAQPPSAQNQVSSFDHRGSAPFRSRNPGPDLVQSPEVTVPPHCASLVCMKPHQRSSCKGTPVIFERKAWVFTPAAQPQLSTPCPSTSVSSLPFLFPVVPLSGGVVRAGLRNTLAHSTTTPSLFSNTCSVCVCVCRSDGWVMHCSRPDLQNLIIVSGLARMHCLPLLSSTTEGQHTTMSECAPLHDPETATYFSPEPTFGKGSQDPDSDPSLHTPQKPITPHPSKNHHSTPLKPITPHPSRFPPPPQLLVLCEPPASDGHSTAGDCTGRWRQAGTPPPGHGKRLSPRPRLSQSEAVPMAGSHGGCRGGSRCHLLPGGRSGCGFLHPGSSEFADSPLWDFQHGSSLAKLASERGVVIACKGWGEQRGMCPFRFCPWTLL